MSNLPVLIGIAAFAVVTLMLLRGSSPRARLRERAAKLKTRSQPAQKKLDPAASTSLRKSRDRLPPLILWLMNPLPDFSKLAGRLERAGSTLGPKQYMLRCLLALGIITCAPLVVHKSPLIGLGAGVVLAVWLPLRVLDFFAKKRQAVFLRQFPDAIDLIVRGLRSGLPVSESITLVATELPMPVSGAFAHVMQTMKLGVPMEKALLEVANRLNYTEFNFFVTSLILQRETGGNLSEILNNLGEVLRKRFLMQAKIKAMTSEARMTALIIGGLPFVMGGAVTLLKPDYMSVLVTDPRGHHALAVAAAMLFFGVYAMKRMAKFEI